MPTAKPLHQRCERKAERHLAEKNRLIPEVTYHCVSIPMWSARIWIVPFIKLDAAFGVHEHGPVRGKIVGYDPLIVVHVVRLATPRALPQGAKQSSEKERLSMRWPRSR